MRIFTAIAAAVAGALLLTAPTAFADPARDNILRAEAQIMALNPADAAMAAPTDYQIAKQRLQEARDAEGKKMREESMWRSDEALLLADIVQENIKLRGLERTVAEIEAGVQTLRRELNS